MPSLLVKVKTNMSIYAHEKVHGLLEGQYGSVFKGRSMDFDDLREYVPGDDIKDIDWKATARSGNTLIKRYIAVRKHNILVIVDTGKGMAAVSESGELKSDVAIMLTGMMGYIAQKHGDLIALVSGDDTGSSYMRLSGNGSQLERMLQHIQSSTATSNGTSNIAKQLEFVIRTIRRKMFIIVVADDIEIDTDIERLLRRLSVQHELMWATVGDVDVTDSKWHGDSMSDVSSDTEVPLFMRMDTSLSESLRAMMNDENVARQTALRRLGINSERFASQESVVHGLLRLLERQKHAKRR